MAFIPVYILILAVTIVIDYFAGIFIEKSAEGSKKIWLIVSIISTCLVLFVFKYFNFFNTNFAKIADFFGLTYPDRIMNIILPIGLSFHTFQSLSYVVEVYKGNQKAERHFGIYSLYVMFYPQLVAGPIERPQNLLHQFYEKHKFEYENVVFGLKQIGWGLFKKVVVADSCATGANYIFSNYTTLNGSTLVAGAILFAFQIYCDFSGYSDIAIGSARVMGFRLMKNFNMPYFASSIPEFWQRWHISLSTWFRDYVYIPLGGNRKGEKRQLFNSIITFTISGLWHGANWTYIFWGFLNGLYYVPAIFLKSTRKRIFPNYVNVEGLQRIILVLFTFSLTVVAWIFFRAENLKKGFSYLNRMFSSTILSYPQVKSYSTAITLIILLLVFEFIQRHKNHELEIEHLHVTVRWAFYTIIFVSVLLSVNFHDQSEFIYFQF